jgi:hypothetical protein
MQFVITTQALENYGAHCESGKFADGKAYWKFKSGTDYLVTGLDRPQDAMAFVAAIGMDNGIGWKEFPAECMSLEEYLDGCDEEYREFKMKYIKRVDPHDMIAPGEDA